MDIHKEYMKKHGLKESDFDNMPAIWNALISVQEIIDKHESKAENLPIADIVVSDFCECTYIRHRDTWIREDGKVICCHCHKQKH